MCVIICFIFSEITKFNTFYKVYRPKYYNILTVKNFLAYFLEDDLSENVRR